MMTNKQFQKILKKYPDEYIICMDNVFGWETHHDMVDPELYVNTDIGQIEIEPPVYKELSDQTIKKILDLGESWNPTLGSLTEYIRENL